MFSLSTLFGSRAFILRETNYQVLLLTTSLPILGTALISPILDSLIGPFGASSVNIGMMVSAFTAPAIVMIPIAGVLADRYGRKPVLIAAIILFGIAGTAIAFTTNFRVVLGLRFLQGIGFAGINPIVITSIGDLYEGESEATGQGIRFMVSGFSGAVFPVAAGVLILLAWQFPFLMYALAFPVALAVYLWFNEPTNPSQAPSNNVGEAGISYRRALVRQVSHPRVFLILVARSLMNAVWFGFLAYNSLIVINVYGETPVEAGILATIGFLIVSISAGQAGRVTALLNSQLSLLLSANGALGGGLIVILLAPNYHIAIIGITVTAIGFGFLGSIYRSIITGLVPEEFRAGIVSISEAGGQFASTVAPLGIGAVIAFLSPTMGVSAALQVAGVSLAVMAGGGSILCLLVANISPPLPMKEDG